jgi:hypothetical protein
MKKMIFTMLVALFAIVSAVEAQNPADPFPFQFSTNTTDGAVWYRIKSFRSTNAGIVNYATHIGDGALKSEYLDEESDAQLFAFIGDTDGFDVYNKSYLDNGAKAINNGVVTISSEEWTNKWKVVKTENPEETYAIYDAVLGTDKCWHATMFDWQGYAIVIYGIGDSGSFLTFEKVDTGTGIAKIKTGSDVNVFSRDRTIYVQGAKGNMTITSLTGASVTVDAKTPYFVKSTGIYIVRVNGEAHKVIVK